MSYCDDCSLLDICGKEGCCDEAMTFCADKNKFIHVSILDKIRAEIEQNAYPIVHGVNNHELGMTLYGILQVIDKYRKGQTEE